MNYLVLGGAGFQGQHLCRRLLAEGGNVRILDREPAHSRSLLLANRGSLEWVEGNLEDPNIVESVLSDVDVVFHLISTTLPKTSNDDPLYDVTSNILPTIRLLELARRKSVRKIIFFSSGGTVYGVSKSAQISEEHPTNPICAYGIHKLAIEKYLHLYYSLYGQNYAVMRIANPYGENQPGRKGQGVIPVFMRKMIHGDPIEIWGNGSVVRDYIYLDDVIDAAISLVEYDGQHKIFNIGSGHGLSLLEVLAEISRVLERNPQVSFKPARPLDVPVNVLDISRAVEELGWRPKTSFSHGISMMGKHLLQQQFNNFPGVSCLDINRDRAEV